MSNAQFYTCPKCQQRVNAEKHPPSGPCPFCGRLEDGDEDRTSREYRGSRRADFERFGVYVDKVPVDEPKPEGPPIGLYIRTAVIMVVLMGLLYYAAPTLYTMRAESAFAKPRYVETHRGWFNTISNDPTVQDGSWPAGQTAVNAARPGGILDQTVGLFQQGRSACRTIALLTGLLGAAAIGGMYYANAQQRLTRRRQNVVGALTLTALLVINGGAVQHYSSQQTAAYEPYDSQVDTMLGVLAFAALKSRNAPLAMSHLQEGAPLHVRGPQGETYLHAAADRGLEQPAKRALDMGVSPATVDAAGKTPLHYAAQHGRISIMAALVAHDADVNAADRTGKTPLHYAAERNAPAALHFLLERGAHPNHTDQNGIAPLFVAVEHANEDNVLALLDAGAKTDAKNEDGVTLLQMTMKLVLSEVSGEFSAIDLAEFPELNMLSLLVKHGADVNAPDAQGRTALHLATAMRSTVKPGGAAQELLDAIIGILFENGADPAARDANNEPAYTLIDAAQFGHTQWATRLLDEDPNRVHHITPGGKTALQVAIEQSNPEIVRVLLDAGADMHHWNNEADTALHHAARNGDTAIVQALLDNGYQLEPHALDMDSPLAFAASNGNVEIVRLLLEHGVIGDVDNPRLDHPLLEAARQGHQEIIELLLDNGFEANGAATESGNTPLHLAAREGRVEAVRLLLDRGADTAAWNNSGQTPLDTARQNNHATIATHLKRAEANR